MVLNTLHLFAGAGGGILADLLLGHRPVGAVEIEPYARRVLLCRQADGLLPKFPVWDDVRTFRADNPDTAEYIERLRGIKETLCISGGFPCQDISSAGKRAGITGERSGLWKEFARIIGEIRPRYIFVENSNVLIRRGLDVVLSDVAALGYSFAWGIISAGDVGAPHLRKRFWGLAISNPNDRRILRWLRGIEENQTNETFDGGRKEIVRSGQWGQTKSRMGRVAHGLSDWMDDCQSGTLWMSDEKELPRIIEQCENRRARLKAIGNAQAPLCAAVAFEVMKETLEKCKKGKQ